ncbi:hypothetical protein HN415_09800 [Candidatus Woesearchaeota archaeon]|jgi:phosphate uptake regulator|nr:hypothetical protein [Candidatus Woesearchaeota archaeon]
MKRKINRVGQNTLTVSLPTKWVKKIGIKQGDELDIFEEGRNLTIGVGNKRKKIKNATINIDNFNKMMVNRFFHEFYRQGIEKIVVKFSQNEITNYKKNKKTRIDKHIKKLIERFIGMEITSQSSNQIIIETLISNEEYQKIDVVKNRIFFLIKEFLEEFLIYIDKDFSKFHEISYDYHDNISKFISYYMRLLHFSDIPREKRARLFGLFIIVDKVIDKLRHTSERINTTKKVSTLTKNYLKEIFDQFILQFDIILKKNFSRNDLNLIIKLRYDLFSRFNKEKFTINELRILSECYLILDTIVDFSETYVAMNMERFVDDY